MSKISNFGYTKVTIKEKTKLVQKVFSDVAFNYDLMNDVMSFGAHRLWKSKFIDIVNPTYSDKIIDVGSGSGDLVLEIQKRKLNVKIDIVDLNKEMLREGKKRIKKGNVNFYEQNAENLGFNNKTNNKKNDKNLKKNNKIIKPLGTSNNPIFFPYNTKLKKRLISKHKNK